MLKRVQLFEYVFLTSADISKMIVKTAEQRTRCLPLIFLVDECFEFDVS